MAELGLQQFGLHEGQVLAGKYRVERILGVGGMGVVVAAHHVQLDEFVAIKLLLPEKGGTPISARRFVREARAAVKIKSEHVARVFDVGTLEDGAPYIVMEFLEGSDLADRLAKDGPLPIPQAVEFILQACVALAEAHQLGIIHRDLKPSNLFCTKRSDGQITVKVLDFGISKMRDVGVSVSGAATGEGTLLGSPLYMSPEQLNSSRDVESATDVWSLGVVLYQLVSGAMPFYGHTLTEVATKIALQPPTPLKPLRPDVPSGLEAVITRCLQKAPADRYLSVADLAVALVDFAPRRARVYVDRIAGAPPPESPRTRSSPPPSATLVAAGAPGPLSTTGSKPVSGNVRSDQDARTSVRRTVARSAIVVAAVGAATGVLLLYGPSRTPHSSIGLEGSSPRPPGTSDPLPVAPAATTQAAQEAPVASASAPPATPARPLASSHPVVTKPRPRVEPVPAATPHAPATTASAAPGGCKVVSFFDSDGNQHFKQDCGSSK